jgi:hypothetical protein
MSLLKNCRSVRINAILHIFFTAAAVETLHGVATSCEKGGRGKSRVTKISFFSIFWTFWAAHPLECTRALQIQFAVDCN